MSVETCFPPTRGTGSRHPIQPLGPDELGVIRFKRNKIVEFVTEGKLNELTCMDFPAEDWEQLAQLIGYSLSGFGELPYVTDEVYEAAAEMAEQSEASRVPELIDGIDVARLVKNLEETSYNEGSIDLACRCSDALTVIKSLLHISKD